MVRAFVGIGSNLGDRESRLARAVERLDHSPGIRVVRRSRLHETEPVGIPDQPKFLNGVIELETDLEPRPLLEHLMAVEASLGRVRSPDVPRWGPRPIDLDLLIYGDLTIDEPDLHVPHPRLREREFVLLPLSELEPEMVRELRKDSER